MTEERWLPVPGYEGSYEVSDQGRVRSLDRRVNVRGRWGPETRFYKGTVREPCAGGTNKYLMVVLSVNNRQCTRTIHSLVLEAFVGPCPRGEEGRHLNCTHYDNRLTNLAYGTRRKNREDSRAAGTLAMGEQIAQHKLTTAEVLEIRAAPGRHEDIAGAYGVSRTQISRIKRLENWAHV